MDTRPSGPYEDEVQPVVSTQHTPVETPANKSEESEVAAVAPGKSAKETLWQIIAQHVPKWVLVSIAVLVLLVGGAFAIWSSLPSVTKERIIAWFAPQRLPKSGLWRVDAALGSKQIGRGMPLNLMVEADHDGFVWVFDVKGNVALLVYPHEKADVEAKRNVISVGVRRAIPGPDDAGGLRAETHPGKEVLIVIVNGSPSPSDALARLGTLRPDLSIKAVPIKTGEWGATELRFEVK